eukprot:gene20471-23252_t
MSVYFKLVFWFAFVFVSSLSSLCPVSKHYGPNQPFHRYPYNFYLPLVEPRQFNAYNCNIHINAVNEPEPSPQVTTICDRNVSLCPIREENIQSALSIASWPQYADAFRHIGKKANINVFYLGGSMTCGTETYRRCRCSSAEDYRCPTLPPIPTHLVNEQCSWPSHLSRWLNRTYPDTSFHFDDFSFGGRASDSSAFFIDKVHYSTANLSNPALFFLDYSVNDLFQNKSHMLETYIHTIYNNFGQRYNVHPTVVILEQYAHGKIQTAEPVDTDYIHTYRMLAKRFSLILISMREVYWTYFGLPGDRSLSDPDPSKRFYPISPLNVNVHMPLHAPWYIHLFMADVLAECIKRISVHFKGKTVVNANTIQNLHNKALVPAVTYVPPHPIPSPLVDRSNELHQVCNLSLPFSVGAVPKPIDIPEHLLDWSKGWIEHVSHGVPGWEIKSSSDPTTRTLSFPVTGDVAALRHSVLKINYLVSYEGMGTLSLHLCGAPLAGLDTVDALWAPRFSVPRPIVHTPSATDVARCQALPPNKRFVSIIYAPGQDQLELRAVHGHQCKIFSVQICTPVFVAP